MSNILHLLTRLHFQSIERYIHISLTVCPSPWFILYCNRAKCPPQSPQLHLPTLPGSHSFSLRTTVLARTMKLSFSILVCEKREEAAAEKNSFQNAKTKEFFLVMPVVMLCCLCQLPLKQAFSAAFPSRFARRSHSWTAKGSECCLRIDWHGRWYASSRCHARRKDRFLELREL